MASKGRVLNVGQNWPYVWACETQMWKRAILQHCINSKRYALSNVTISSLRMLIVWLHFFFRPPWFMLRCFSYLFCDSTRSGSIWNIVEKLSLLLPAYTWEGGVISVRAIERNKYLHWPWIYARAAIEFSLRTPFRIVWHHTVANLLNNSNCITCSHLQLSIKY